MDGVPARKGSWSGVKYKRMAQKCAIFFWKKFRRITSNPWKFFWEKPLTFWDCRGII